MKVLLVVGTLNAGGLERFVTRIAKKAIHTNSFEPIVLCLVKRSGIFLLELEASGILVIEAPGGWARNLASMLELGKMIKHLEVDIIHSQVNFSIFQQWLIYNLSGAKKIAFTERNCYPLVGIWRIRRIIQFHFIKFFGASYSANSARVQEHLAKMVKYSARKIPVIPNGVDVEVISKDKRDHIRSRFGWDQNNLVIGYVARMNLHKGHLYFLKVIHELQKISKEKIKICIVGDGPLMQEIKDRITALQLTEATTLTGIVTDVENIMPSFDLLCLFSEREGMPNVVIEAMSCGVPVVANPVGNVPELLADGVGFINDSIDECQTANLINDLIDNPEMRSSAMVKGVQKIKNEFGLDHTFTTLLDYYKSL